MPSSQQDKKTRCSWCGTDPLYIAYHDLEWGVPVHDDRKLFEFLILEGFQAGLSWITILRKRDHFRKAFDEFDPHRIAKYTPARVGKLMQDEGIVRNRLKIESTIKNAQAYLRLLRERGSFGDYLWSFADQQARNSPLLPGKPVPATSPASDAMSKGLKKEGFAFVGSTICYAFMQAVGMVNDHRSDCFRFAELAG
ncbi:MAG: DNA-3-methyladenine glycosylase I [Flavobacteriales bacterium]|nr:DNA-3-methyladenine glycosylase I [Flavobacteriales bacterium]MCB9449452.1 DNA-3-methyladenine glycosylase I [Flavobacteriales bacterium]